MAPWPRTSLPQVMSLYEYHITEAYVDYTPESTGEQRSPNDSDHDDVTIGKMLSDACRRRTDHSQEEGLSSCLSSSVSHDGTERPVVCCTFDSQVFECSRKRGHSSESEQITILLERQREQILADCQADRADHDRRNIQKLNEKRSSRKQGRKIVVLIKETNDFDKIINFFHEQLLKQNWDIREAHEESLSEMEELKRFQGLNISDTIAKKLINILSLNSLARYWELQNEINCMDDSRDFSRC